MDTAGTTGICHCLESLWLKSAHPKTTNTNQEQNTPPQCFSKWSISQAGQGSKEPNKTTLEQNPAAAVSKPIIKMHITEAISSETDSISEGASPLDVFSTFNQSEIASFQNQLSPF